MNTKTLVSKMLNLQGQMTTTPAARKGLNQQNSSLVKNNCEEEKPRALKKLNLFELIFSRSGKEEFRSVEGENISPMILNVGGNLSTFWQPDGGFSHPDKKRA